MLGIGREIWKCFASVGNELLDEDEGGYSDEYQSEEGEEPRSPYVHGHMDPEYAEDDHYEGW